MHQGDELDQLLTAGLRQALDCHRGRSLAAFEAQAQPPGDCRERGRWRIGPIVGLIGGLAAAALVGIVIWVGAKPPQRQQTSPIALREPPVVADASQELERVTTWRTYDHGLAVLDGNMPVRQYRRQVVQQIRWRDPRTQAEIAWTVPRQDVVLVRMATH